MAKLRKAKACVIGSGAGGGVVAKELGERGFSVVVLEVGRRFNPLRDYTSALNDWERAGKANRERFRAPRMDTITVSGPFTHKPIMAFGVGGTTLRYYAYVPRMRPDDFRVRTSDGVGMDWPISYEDLAPYYRKVELELGVSGQSGNPWSPPMEPYPNPPFEFSYANKIINRGCDRMGIRLWPVPVARLSRPLNGRPSCVQCGDCLNGCMTKAKSSIDVTYIPKAEATGKVEIRPESVVTRITVDKRGRAKSVIYFDKNGVEQEQEAEIIVVSAGTIQSPRLLLNSKCSLFPDGLANSSGMVGKNFMQHLTVFSNALFPDRIDSYRGFYGGAYSEDFAGTNPGNGFARGWVLELTSGARGPTHMASFTPGWGAWHKDYMRNYFGHIAGIAAGGEQLPDERNRVEIDPEVVDDYGMPVPRVTMEPRENDKLMLAAIEKNIREIYAAAGATKILKMRIWRPGQGAHNMGTCRMGNDSRMSVLNDFCQCHDIPNLFVIDGSFFVTGSTTNPSLTIMAMATRASEHIIEEAKKGNI
jgi:choline dehydrogenase-like flavoprotein